MKKIIAAFAAGQALQLLILFVGQSITYSTNLFLFCVILGIAAALMLCIGSAISVLEMAQQDMEDEVPPLPKELIVTNDRVMRRDPDEEAEV